MLGRLAVLGRLALEWRAGHGLFPGGRGTGVLAAQVTGRLTAVFHLCCSSLPSLSFNVVIVPRLSSVPWCPTQNEH